MRQVGDDAPADAATSATATAGELVYLALGSNLGDRAANLQAALQRLDQLPGVAVLRCSSFHETAPVGDGPPQGPFLNAVAELRCTLPPLALLAIAKALEAAAGRRLPAPRNAPRPLDLDILFHGQLRLDSRELQLPHPRWQDRSFVTAPLQELGLDLAALPRWQQPLLVDHTLELVARCAGWLSHGCTIGLVPTMGALHAGHASLLQAAREANDRVVATIFVNPLQFAAGEDYASYPRELGRDLQVCADAGVDAVFAPPVEQMYEPGFCSHIGVGEAAQGMEGAVRPEHFRGVATVVGRLFALVRPQRAYFGEKDAQQLAVVRRLVRDLGFPLEIVGCPILREPDGLAMSSRNVYLEPADRQAATVLYRALASARHAFLRGERDAAQLLQRARTVLQSEPRASLDYLELRREGDLLPLPPGPVIAGRMLVAARFTGGQRPVRLLDNMTLLPEIASQ